MAKVSFSALIENILGKLAGSVFQDSYGGYQVRTRVTPRNPQSQYQQLRRGAFGYISSLWRTLTPAQRGTFIAAAASTGGGLNLFVESNVNLSLVLQPIINSYITSLAPVSMPISIVNLTPPIFTVQASGFTTTVPAGMALLIFSTAEKFPSKIFTNPSQYSPVLSLPAGTDLSVPLNISADWIALFGQFTAGKRICVKSALINIINGKRTDSLPVCAIQDEMLPYTFYYANLVQAGVGNPVAAVAAANTIPAIAWSRLGAGIYNGVLAGAFPLAKTFCTSVPAGFSSPFFGSLNRIDDNTLQIITVSTGGVTADNLLNQFGVQVLVFN